MNEKKFVYATILEDMYLFKKYYNICFKKLNYYLEMKIFIS